MNTFTANVNGKETEFCVRLPTADDHREADKIHNKTFKDALDSGAILRLKLEKTLRDQGIWDDNREARVQALRSEISEYERILFQKGGIKLSEAKNIALAMADKRQELREVLAERNSLESMTAEAQAENARFNFLVSRVTVYNDTKKPYFKDFADYLNKGGDEVASKAATLLVKLLFGLNDYESELPENKFLKKWGFVDEKFRLINKEGKLVDREGRLIDEQGRYINEQGEFVDKDGNLVDAEGNYKTDAPVVFLDDNGNPVADPEAQVEPNPTC